MSKLMKKEISESDLMSVSWKKVCDCTVVNEDRLWFVQPFAATTDFQLK